MVGSIITMEQIINFQEAEGKILADINACVSRIRKIVDYEFSSTIDGIGVLLRLRQLIYEDLNQIQHEDFAFRAAQFLRKSEFKGYNLKWFWNPRQTGNESEPDLRATNNKEIVLSAEVTTSERPIGSIDSRMRDTLKKLANMPGRKFYFVRTKEMENRAITKTSKLSVPIEVLRI